MERRYLTYITLGIIVITSIIFYLTNMNSLVGIILLGECILVLIFNNKIWGDRFKEDLGIALFSGLLVSFMVDINKVLQNSSLQKIYFLGFAISIILLINGASKGEDL